ncbi:bleomycin hydrolase [Saccharomycopsis crataegensis]|uniref:Cysteine proteinase 1, mitochondrial n=1 Tax=Saccharomycopsis crataegensis TaxID=43959 RepID=A0AAV5QMV6_9ASCO|nr:bleomycin hydrolase [Saccharomycopsis crataegensis]
MGNNASTHTSSYSARRVPPPSESTDSFNEKEYLQNEDLVNRLQTHLNLDDYARNQGPSTFKDLPNPIVAENINSWESDILSTPKNLFAMNAFTKNEPKKLLTKRSSNIKDNENIFNLKVDFEGNPVTNQKSSGRCWLFASTNIFRIPVQKKFNISDFQLSQQYLFFYDKLEKSNQFLTNIIDTAEDDLDARVVSTLFADPISDGGQWTMVVNLIEKYGIVPNTVFPDAYSATSSGTLNLVLVNKLKQDALVLRKLVTNKRTSKEEILELKEKYLKEVYKVLTLTLGVPPKADESFSWEFVDKFDNFHRIDVTPVEFFKKFVGWDLKNYVSLIHDPRNEYYKLYSVDKLNNVVGGEPVLYINVPLDDMKEAVIKNLKNNQAVFFGSDVGKFFSGEEGILDLDNHDYELGFDIQLKLSKAERLRTHTSQMTHAMVITGVHMQDGKPVRWRVENSWGKDSGKDGYLVMTDSWFDEYVYQAVTDLSHVDKKIETIYKGEIFKTFNLWDPMGSLA